MSARPGAVATIERRGQSIAVTPPCWAILREVVTAQHVAAVHGAHGFLTVPWRERLVVIEDMPWGERTWLPAGLEPVAWALLEEAGLAVVVEPRPIAPLPTPRPPSGAGPHDPAVLDFVRGRERGLIRLGPDVAPERLVAQLHHAFPGITIAVAVTRRDDVGRFGRRLKALAPDACWSTGDDFPADPGPLVVSTYWGLGDNGVALYRRDVLICLHGREALGRDLQTPIVDAKQARLFGFLPDDERLAPRDRDRIWARFGFDALDVPRHSHVARPVAVGIGRIAGARPAVDTDSVALKRHGIWHHPIRNRRAARLAAALARGDRAAVAAELPTLTSGTPAAPSVVVLVEGAEHAAELARLLPGWDVLAGPHVDPSDLPGPVRSASTSRHGEGPAAAPRAIATLDGLIEVDWANVDIVVRADGGGGVPTSLAASPATAEPGRGPLLLVDFDDRHHPELRRRARGRREAYLALGWPVDGRGGPMTPLDLFRATRPRGAR